VKKAIEQSKPCLAAFNPGRKKYEASGNFQFDNKYQPQKPTKMKLESQHTTNTKVYTVFLNDKNIGTTALEKADAAMGVVFGRLYLIDIVSRYDFFKHYCIENALQLVHCLRVWDIRNLISRH
jgi:hypothetical protein